MKISTLKEDLIPAVYDHHGEKLTLKVDRNIITPAFMRRVAELAGEANSNGHKPEMEDANGNVKWGSIADSLEKNARVSGAMLAADLIREWDLTEDDEVTPVPITEETFAALPPLLVTGLFSFAMEQAQTVKKTTSVTMPDGLSEKAEDALDM